jgi:hypothetical protein
MNKITAITLGLVAGPLVEAIKDPGNKTKWSFAILWTHTMASQFISAKKMPPVECFLNALERFFEPIKETVSECKPVSE